MILFLFAVRCARAPYYTPTNPTVLYCIVDPPTVGWAKLRTESACKSDSATYVIFIIHSLCSIGQCSRKPRQPRSNGSQLPRSVPLTY